MYPNHDLYTNRVKHAIIPGAKAIAPSYHVFVMGAPSANAPTMIPNVEVRINNQSPIVAHEGLIIYKQCKQLIFVTGASVRTGFELQLHLAL